MISIGGKLVTKKGTQRISANDSTKSEERQRGSCWEIEGLRHPGAMHRAFPVYRQLPMPLDNISARPASKLVAEPFELRKSSLSLFATHGRT